jgi:septum formation protein
MPPPDPPPSYEELRNIPTPINASAGANAPPEALRSPRRPPPLLPLDLPALNQLRQKRVVLASASPRRKQLLSIVSMLLPAPSGAD